MASPFFLSLFLLFYNGWKKEREKRIAMERIILKDEYPELSGGVLESLCLEKVFDTPEEQERWARPALLVIPGGAYSMVSKREGEPVAAFFLSQGFQTFILRYSLDDVHGCYPEPMKEAAAAVDYLKRHARRYSVNPREIFALGFSAGGHLAGTLAYGGKEKKDWTGGYDCALAGVGLSYPVVDEQSHPDSFCHLLGPSLPAERRKALAWNLSLVHEVGRKSVPTFLWSTEKDDLVPCDGVLRLARKLKKCSVPFSLRIYPEGGHGLSLGWPEINPGTSRCGREGIRDVEAWPKDCADFFRRFCSEPF